MRTLTHMLLRVGPSRSSVRLAGGCLLSLALLLVLISAGLDSRHEVGPADRESALIPPLPADLEAQLGLEPQSMLARFAEVRPTSMGHYLHRWRLLPFVSDKGLSARMREEISAALTGRLDRLSVAFKGELIDRTPDGPSVRVYSKRYSDTPLQFESHVDELLALCAEVGAPATTEIRCGKATYTLADLLRTSRLRFSAYQDLEWSSEAYAHYLPGEPTWTNHLGEECSYDDMLRRLLEASHEGDACFGLHKPIAAAKLIIADEIRPCLSRSTRAQAMSYFSDLAEILPETQLRTGGWDRNWRNVTHTPGSQVPATERATTLAEQLMATGHLLEWMQLVHGRCDIDAGSYARAIRFAAQTIGEELSVPSSTLAGSEYCGISHCCHALATATIPHRSLVEDLHN
jgi:hypothetical protein